MHFGIHLGFSSVGTFPGRFAHVPHLQLLLSLQALNQSFVVLREGALQTHPSRFPCAKHAALRLAADSWRVPPPPSIADYST